MNRSRHHPKLYDVDPAAKSTEPEHIERVMESVLSNVSASSCSETVLTRGNDFDGSMTIDGVDIEHEGDVRADVPEAFRVNDEKAASWVVRKVLEARTYAERVRAWALEEQRRAERDENWLLRRFGSELEVWLRSEL